MSIELRKLKKIEKITFFFLSNYPTKVYTNLNKVSSYLMQYRVLSIQYRVEKIRKREREKAKKDRKDNCKIYCNFSANVL